MEFTLRYSGELKTNADKLSKHKIRECFHVQMKELWNHQPLKAHRDLITGLKKPIGKFTFVPLISEKLGITAEIDIMMLRPGTPGKIIVEGGDIDNRLKTLFDSLRSPNTLSELPDEAEPDEREEPFFCLLDDDNLITGLSVKTDRLLKEHLSQSFVEMFIHVSTIKHIDYLATSGI